MNNHGAPGVPQQTLSVEKLLTIIGGKDVDLVLYRERIAVLTEQRDAALAEVARLTLVAEAVDTDLSAAIRESTVTGLDMRGGQRVIGASNAEAILVAPSPDSLGSWLGRGPRPVVLTHKECGAIWNLDTEPAASLRCACDKVWIVKYDAATFGVEINVEA